MDLHGGFTCSLILVLASVAFLCTGQDIVCQHACRVGYTCAMVRNGTGAPAPGCIDMQEALMLAQALEGGPTGPRGSGIGSQPVSPSMTHSHETAHGTLVTHSHEVPSTAVQQTNPNQFDVIRTPAQQPPANPFFPPAPRPGFPGMGGPFRWMRPGSFVPLSTFTGATGQPFFQPSRPQFGPIGFGDPFQTQRTFPGSQISQIGRTFQGGQVSQVGSMLPGGQVSQVGSTFPRGQVNQVGSTFPGGQISQVGSTFLQPVRQQPVRTLPPQLPPIRQSPQRPPPRNTQFTVLEMHAQCRPCFYHYECLEREFCGMSSVCSGSLVCLPA